MAEEPSPITYDAFKQIWGEDSQLPGFDTVIPEDSQQPTRRWLQKLNAQIETHILPIVAFAFVILVSTSRIFLRRKSTQ